MNQPVYIFDVDGVINDIHTYNADSRVLEQINKLLDDGCYVALNTGRGYAWVKKDVIDYLKKKRGAADNLNRFFVSVEMGGLTVEFVDGAERHERTAFSLLPEQIERVKQLYEQHKVEGVMRWYEAIKKYSPPSCGVGPCSWYALYLWHILRVLSWITSSITLSLIKK